MQEQVKMWMDTQMIFIYDPSLNSWTAVTAFPGTLRTEGVGFSISD